MKKETVIRCEYYEIEKLIEATWPQYGEYSIPCQEEKGNDISLTFDISGKPEEEIEDITFEGRDWTDWKSGDKASPYNKGCRWDMYRTWEIMEHLCKMGKLEAGEYLVNICW